MKVRRGDIVLASYPFASGAGGKKRAVFVVQNGRDNQRLTNTIVVQITSNTRRVLEPTRLLVEVASTAGRQSGLLSDSVISCSNPCRSDQYASALMTSPRARVPRAQ
jgi:mRNA interferase MazF